jgi:hypothetical protein
MSIYKNKNYEVIVIENAMGETGERDSEGYAVVNNETGVIEHTTMVLPQAVFQADAFMGALGQLEDTDEPEAGIITDVDPEILN